jgi:deoxyribodipyrimidine photolyase-related protein
MALYADGGLIATKPYAASANYISKMSDCCPRCSYNPRKTVEENACPFNSLYWDFLARNSHLMKKNPRMNMVMALLAKRNPSELKSTRQRAKRLRKSLGTGQPI